MHDTLRFAARCSLVPFLFTLSLAGAACGGSDDAQSPGGSAGAAGGAQGGSSGLGGSGGTGTSTGGTGASGGGAGTGGGAGNAGVAGTGSGGAGGSGQEPTCEQLRDAITQWIAEHQGCDPENPCVRLTAPTLPDNDSAFCDKVAAPGQDSQLLAQLVAQWNAKACQLASESCGYLPGQAVCENGQCVLEADSSCAECDWDDLSPQCTVAGHNAYNPCTAENCLKEQVAQSGWCPDSTECVEAGGTCVESVGSDVPPPCADGTRWDFEDPWAKQCPSGQVRNECCIPWSEPCSYVAGAYTLSVDPFTCEAPTGAGQPWVCVQTDQQSACDLSGQMLQPLGATYNAEIRIESSLGSEVTVTGQHNETGRTFECTGTVSFSFGSASEWECSGCSAESDCVSCTVSQVYGCGL